MRSRYAALLVALLLAPAAAAQTPGECDLGQSTAELSLSDVRAPVFNKGTLFYSPVTGYEVPRGSGIWPIQDIFLTLGGRVGGEVRTAAALYGIAEFWPGPLDDGAALPNPADCSAFDRIYRVSAPELAGYEAGNPPSATLAAWPVGLGAPAINASGTPIVPTSREQTVDLEAGERPVVYGTETLFWVENDVGNEHTLGGSAPLGVEVRMTAFSINDPAVAALDQSTFYRYHVINRSGAVIEDFHLGFHIDHTMGGVSDDYVGSDVARQMWYVYNADNEDEEYGTAPPALGVDFLSGGHSTFRLINSGPGSPNTYPANAMETYNYLTGHWLDGAPLTRGGGGYNPGGSETVLWSFEGDPITSEYWSERDAYPAPGQQPNSPAYQRGRASTPPVTLAPGASHTVDIAVVFARGADHLDSVTELRAASDLVQARYDDGSLFETTSGDLGLPPLAAPALLSPDDGTVFTPPQRVVLDWTLVADATSYRIEFADNATFSGVRSQLEAAPPVEVDFSELPMGTDEPIYWRVAGVNEAGVGPSAEARSFTYAFTFEPGAQLLSNGQFAFLEVVGPGGADPCGPDAGSTFGCAEAGGNAVFSGNDRDGAETPNPNGTGQYALFSRGGVEDALTQAAPGEIELRFTVAGSIATHVFGDSNETYRVPFELWDIGIVPLGAGGVPAANDPADDVRLIPILFSDEAPNGAGACAFAFGDIPASESASGFALTDRIYAYYPATTYADFEATAAPLVDAATEGCYLDADRALANLLDGPRVLERIVFADVTGSGTVANLQGTVVRFHTTDPQPVADAAPPSAQALALTIVPNPSRGAATVRFAIEAPGAVRVRVLDVLGREVAVVAHGERRAGAHEVALPGGLASGVYVVAVEVAGDRVARTFTVVR